MLWPIIVVVASNTLYNICSKSTPEKLNPFASLSVTYVVAAVCAVSMYFITSGSKNLFSELSGVNWTSFVLGIAVVGLEFGFLCVYRSGWNISTGHLVSSIILACVLLIVGLVVYKESISPRKLIGMAVCAVGLVLITK